MLKKIVVLLAAYNGQDWIEEQIESIEDQENVLLDIYISLDVSTDNTINIIDKLSNKYENIRLLPYGKKFGSAAPNFFHLLMAVSFDDYDYIALADQDDIWISNKLSHAISTIEKTNSDGYSSDVIAFWPDGKERIIKKSYQQKKFDHYFEGPGPGCTFVLSKDLAIKIQSHLIQCKDKISLIDWHDWFIYTFARHNGYSWIIDSVPLMRYRQHTSNQLGANSGFKPFLRRVNSVVNGYAIEQARLNVLTLDDSNTFVHDWKNTGRIGIIRLLVNSNNCRRKKSDTFFFAISCVCMLLINKSWIKK